MMAVSLTNKPQYISGLSYFQTVTLPVQTTSTGIALRPIKKRLQPLKARNFNHIPQDQNSLYHMMQWRMKDNAELCRSPRIARNLCSMTDPVQRV